MAEGEGTPKQEKPQEQSGGAGRQEEEEEEIRARWESEQGQLKAKLIEYDTEEWQRDADFAGLQRIGGVDLSFIKGDEANACASLVVLSYPDLEVLYEECRMVTLTAPYVAGFLAFREMPSLVEAVERLKEKDPSLMPQIRNLQKGGDTFSLVESSGRVLGMALKSCNKSAKPIYISVGHKMSLESSVRLIRTCCKYRVPEAIRQFEIDGRSCYLTDKPRRKTMGHSWVAETVRPTYDREHTSGRISPNSADGFSIDVGICGENQPVLGGQTCPASASPALYLVLLVLYLFTNGKTGGCCRSGLRCIDRAVPVEDEGIQYSRLKVYGRTLLDLLVPAFNHICFPFHLCCFSHLRSLPPASYLLGDRVYYKLSHLIRGSEDVIICTPPKSSQSH
ncbi:endonuclease V isoform X2 [Rhinatrema bivittatum]|uniref:endonuclease V isoform X2 n=1 Tax=Rhinatrema bivittatum TaxID=194408 RepID=UPI00112D4A86|nr:endonuclease V isoform X2 [Rhinatrema bivittatum]